MRVHLAIPDGPIEAKIRPKVQPGPTPCPLFFPEAEDPITLTPGLWILRLPYPFMEVSWKNFLMGTSRGAVAQQMSCGRCRCRFLAVFKGPTYKGREGGGQKW